MCAGRQRKEESLQPCSARKTVGTPEKPVQDLRAQWTVRISWKEGLTYGGSVQKILMYRCRAMLDGELGWTKHLGTLA